jgi:hypothetical protein
MRGPLLASVQTCPLHPVLMQPDPVKVSAARVSPPVAEVPEISAFLSPEQAQETALIAATAIKNREYLLFLGPITENLIEL